MTQFTWNAADSGVSPAQCDWLQEHLTAAENKFLYLAEFSDEGGPHVVLHRFADNGSGRYYAFVKNEEGVHGGAATLRPLTVNLPALPPEEIR